MPPPTYVRFGGLRQTSRRLPDFAGQGARDSLIHPQRATVAQLVPARPNGVRPFGRGAQDSIRMFIYILQSLVDGSSYVGLSENPENRLVSHNRGEVTSTRPKRPWKIIHLEKHSNRIEARAREKYLKSAAGRRWRKTLMPR